MPEQPIPHLYERLAEDARARAASAPTEYIRRDYLELAAHYELRSRPKDEPAIGANR